MLLGAGGNITVSVGRDGVLMVDAGRAQMTDQVLAAIRQLQSDLDLRDRPLGSGAETRSSVASRNTEPPAKPIRYIMNTSADPDHAGGNEKIRAAGRTFTGGNVAGNIADAGEGAAILAHENVLQRLLEPEAGEQKAPTDAQPTDTYYTDSMKLSHFFNGEGIQVIHQPSAHTEGDSLVWFRGSDIIAAGDIYLDRVVSGDRREARRHDQRRDRRAQSDPRSLSGGVQDRRRHVGDSRPWPAQ